MNPSFDFSDYYNKMLFSLQSTLTFIVQFINVYKVETFFKTVYKTAVLAFHETYFLIENSVHFRVNDPCFQEVWFLVDKNILE